MFNPRTDSYHASVKAEPGALPRLPDVVITAVDGRRLQVRHLEALNGTPIIDVKPVISKTSVNGEPVDAFICAGFFGS